MLPCGKCAACRQRIKNEWTTRMVLEAKHALNSWFVTITYNDTNLPRLDGYTVLYDRDMTLFLKRIRKAEVKSPQKELLKGRKFKYVWFGEYGSKTYRPHYHAIFYNLTQYTAERLHRIWKMGTVDVQSPRNIEACQEYSAKYITKLEDFKHFRVRPMKRQSMNIGLSWLKEHPENVKDGLILMDGYKIPLPKNWRSKFYTEQEWFTIRQMSEIQLEIEQQEAMEKLLELNKGDYREQYELIEAQRKEYARKIIKKQYENEKL